MPRLDVGEWQTLRRDVKRAMTDHGVEMDVLARRVGFAYQTLSQCLQTTRVPSALMTNGLRGWLESLPQAVAQSPNRPDGDHEATPLEAETLKRLKARRHATPLTSGTLAETIGVGADDLTKALAGLPVASEAASRLADWATT